MKAIHLELLVNRRVYAADGKRALGRIEDFEASIEGDACRVMAFHLGAYAFLERLAGSDVARAVLRSLGARSGFRVRWDQLDLADPERPRLRCEVSELKRLE